MAEEFPDFYVRDDEADADDQDRRLRSVRAERTVLSRQAVRRGRDWSFVGAIVLLGVALQLIFLAAGKFSSENDLAGWTLCALTTMAFAASYILFRRGRRLAVAARAMRD